MVVQNTAYLDDYSQALLPLPSPGYLQSCVSTLSEEHYLETTILFYKKNAISLKSHAI